VKDRYAVATAAWGAAGQLLQMRWKIRGEGWAWGREDCTYNERLQMTRQTVQMEGGAVGMDMEYEFPGAGNNGRITSQKDNAPGGEEVVYQYDELDRLISAVTTGPEWGLTFTYDGFGNRLSQTKVESKQGGADFILALQRGHQPGGGMELRCQWERDGRGRADADGV
jgi:YD repeat-containing protein